MSIPLLVLLVVLLLLFLYCAGFTSAAETSLFSLSSMKVKAFKLDPDPRKRLIHDLLAHPGDLLVTIIMLNILVSILIQNVVSSIFGTFSSWFVTVGVPFLLILVFGEVIPKSLGLASNERIAYSVAPSIAQAQNLLLPIRKVFIKVTHLLSRCLFFYLRKEEEISIDELQHALRTSRQYGVLQEEEVELVCGYLTLQESTVKAFMRPREEVISFDVEESLAKLIHLFVDQECSRIPICQGGLDKVLGIMTSRLFFLHRPALNQTLDLLPILKKPMFVPETMGAHALLHQLYNKEESIALVVDEYGSLSGFIALEDLVEVVIGEIVDRRDEKKRYTRAGEGVIIASGKLELTEFEAIFQVELKSENNMVTIGGWLTEKLGDIPKSGAKYMTEEFLFHVLSSDANRVRRVYIRRLKPSQQKKRV